MKFHRVLLRFVTLLKYESLDAWEAEIMDTVIHELQHHLESQAGLVDLARRELEELAKTLHQK